MTITIGSGITIDNGMLIGPVPILIPKNYNVVANGNAQVTTDNPKFGTGSYTSNANAGFLDVTPFSNFAFGSGDFTIEFWYYPLLSSGTGIVIGFRPLNTNGPYPVITMFSNSSPLFIVNGSTVINSSFSIPITAWSAISVVRYQGVTKIYINGAQAGASYTDTNNYLAGSCVIGARDIVKDGATPIRGRLDELRISNIARYTGSYTPATVPFVTDQNTLLLLHCDGLNGSTSFPDSCNTI
jgi:hypothetical protein